MLTWCFSCFFLLGICFYPYATFTRVENKVLLFYKFGFILLSKSGDLYYYNVFGKYGINASEQICILVLQIYK